MKYENPTMQTEETSETTLPLVALDESVVFPYTIVRLGVNADADTATAVEAGMEQERRLLLVARREDADTNAPLAEQLHRVGVVAQIEQSGKLPGGESVVVVQGLVRAEIGEQVQNEPYPAFTYIEHPDVFEHTAELESLMEEARAAIDAVLARRPGIPQEVRNFVRGIEDPGHLADNTGYSPDYSFAERQDLLETFDVAERLHKVRAAYARQLVLLDTQDKLRQDVEDSVSQQQREMFLRQQMRAIQKELGENDAEADELEELRQKLGEANLPAEARKEADRELSRLGRMNTASPEYQMTRTYLEWLAELPWKKPTGNEIDIDHSAEVLNTDHYGLDKVKERILEYLAVRQRRASRALQADEPEDRSREPILALVGPPGVGKTSLGQSIARALGRKFVRMSLGGVRDEAELRGFRRTYIGSAPGRLIQELRRAGSSDPVILLDEIDKLGMDYRGDPSSALLEVLDPEQNHTFTDHYLGVPFDLSKVLFLATANNIDTVPPALRDRLEIIQLSGYTEEEKVRIAEQHLVPRQRRTNSLLPEEVTVTETALRSIINDYTREAGVRSLERQLGNVLRKVTRHLIEQSQTSTRVELNDHVTQAPEQLVVTPEFVRTALGRPRFHAEAREPINQPGISTGLVWTPTGGDIVYVEALSVPGKKELKITGQLGEVMRESAEAALSYVRSRAKALRITPSYFETHSVHLHVPSGAVPKDGPSAGITIATALASAATGRPVRDDIAMTGEITLRGRVMPVGGIKEKVLGAHRVGIRTVILPRRNEADLEDLPGEVRDDMIIVPVDTLDDVLAIALQPEPQTTWQPPLANLFDHDIQPVVYQG